MFPCIGFEVGAYLCGDRVAIERLAKQRIDEREVGSGQTAKRRRDLIGDGEPRRERRGIRMIHERFGKWRPPHGHRSGTTRKRRQRTVAAAQRRARQPELVGEQHDAVEALFGPALLVGVIGTYHHMSEAHLARYTAEFDFRYYTRKVNDAERADAALIGAVGKRLTYRRPYAA